MVKSNEDELKKLHLGRVSQALLDSSPSLSTWMALSAIADDSSQPAFLANARPLRLMWCASCRASCSLRVQPKRHRISVTCLRPDCRKHIFMPLAPRQTKPNPPVDCEQLAPDIAPVATHSGTNPAPLPTSEAAANPSPSLKADTSEESKSKRARSKARASRPGLADLLARRKAEQAEKDSKNQAAIGKGPGSLQSFLTQL